MKRNALLFNMGLNEFWYGNPQDFYVYADYYELKKEQADYNAWLNATYNLFAYRQALSEALSKNPKQIFPKECFSEKENRQKNGIAKNELQERILAGLNLAKEIIKNKKKVE